MTGRVRLTDETWEVPARPGRPPEDAAAPAKCEGLVSGGHACSSYASWLVPEAPFCSWHMPYEYALIADLRRERWTREAGALWLRIFDETHKP